MNKLDIPPKKAFPLSGTARPGVRRIAVLILGIVLGALGFWILKGFLIPLLWAGVFATAIWPLYEKGVKALPGHTHGGWWAPSIFTLLTAILVMVPFALVAIEIGREAIAVVRIVSDLEQYGIPVPNALRGLPILGSYVTDWWQQELASPQAATRLLGHLDRGALFQSARELGAQLLLRSTDLIIMLIALFLLLKSGRSFVESGLSLSDRIFGPSGRQLGDHIATSVRGAVNGLVLVGLGEGIALGIVYAILGLPDPLLLAALTGVLGVIPFGAFAVFGSASIILFVQTGWVSAVILLAAGFLVLALADYLVRPILIGGAVRLPFLWVLLGIIGGLETFGLLGLFLGPVVIAVIMSLWHDLTALLPAAGDQGENLRRTDG
jgi:predicted PurR-regulated permease PerM